MIKPRALREGDTIAVVAPAAGFRRDLLLRGAAYLEGRGFRVRYDSGVFSRKRYLAGDDDRRARELIAAIEDPEVSALFAARGGYGSQRLLPRLRPDLVSGNPKILLGYSDITVLLAFWGQKAGVAGFHGPLVTEMGDLDPRTEAQLWATLTRAEPPPAIHAPDAECWRPGRAEGPLWGGSLTMLTNLLGTPWQPDLRGAVLVLEDVGEKPYQVDRMLSHLLLSGAVSDLKGLLCGPFLGDGDPGEYREVVLEAFEGLRGPILGNFPIGHGKVNLTLPLGLRIGLDAEERSARVLEAAVS